MFSKIHRLYIYIRTTSWIDIAYGILHMDAYGIVIIVVHVVHQCALPRIISGAMNIGVPSRALK